MKSLLFVDERRSPAAIRMDVRWQDGRLAAKQLFDALSGVGIDPGKCQFLNWWERGSRPVWPSISAAAVWLLAWGERFSESSRKRALPISESSTRRHEA